jgi:hypothetical protein
MKITTMVGLAALVAAGCLAEDEDAAVEPAAARSGELQGRYLLGDLVDGQGTGPLHWHVSDAAWGPRGAVAVEVVGASLSATDSSGTYTGTDARFVGVRFTGVGGGEVEITRATRSNVSGVTYYTLRYRGTPSSAWTGYCSGGAATVPLHGHWTRTGLHVDDAHAIAFACADSVAYKCTSWGYVADTVPTMAIWREHQACTRMARADYCSDGTSHTREGTLIDIFDGDGATSWPSPVVTNPASWPPPAADFYFEAAWRAESQPPVCLSRLRWQSLPLNACGTALPDPRVSTNGVFCDEMTLSGMAAADALVYDASVFNDLALHTWEHASNGDQVSTVHGFLSAVAPTTVAPFGSAYDHVDRDGVILRSLPASVLPTDVDEVRTYVKGTDHVVTTAATRPVGATDLGAEGFVFRNARSDTTPLYLYTNGSDYLTTISASPGAGYALLATIGHVWY